MIPLTAEVAIAVPFVGGATALLVGAVCALLIGCHRRDDRLAPQIDRTHGCTVEHEPMVAYAVGQGC